LQRELNASVSFVSNSEQVEIRVEPSASQTDVRDIRIRSEHFEFSMPSVFIDTDVAQASLGITITSQSGASRSYTVNFDRTPSVPARLSVVPLASEVHYQTLRNAQGRATASRFNPAIGMIDARLRESGTYSLAENRVDFTDIQQGSTEMYRAITRLASQGIISGVGNDRFSPSAAWRK